MSNDNQRNPDISHDPDTITDAERKNIETKVRLVLSMAGDIENNPDIVLTVLSYALVHANINCNMTFTSVVKVLADMYDCHPRNPRNPRNPETGDGDE